MKKTQAIVLSIVCLLLVIAIYLYRQNQAQTWQAEPVSEPSVELGFVGSEPTQPQPELLKTVWVWQRTLTVDGTEIIPPYKDFKLTLGVDGRFKSTTDCNSLTGTFTQKSGLLSFEEFASTKMYCPEAFESVYVTQLKTIDGYYFSAEALHLKSSANDLEMVFTAEQ